jgi:hypothetical protein
MTENLQATLSLPNGLTIQASAATPKRLFYELATCAEVMSEGKCGRCGSTDIIPAHRVTKADEHYFNWMCQSCGAQLDLGQHRNNQTLFVKRSLPSGQPDAQHRGWYLWQERSQQGGRQQAQQQQQQAYGGGQQQPAPPQQQGAPQQQELPIKNDEIPF